MLQQEARWLGEAIRELDASCAFPMCNVGSSTAAFREQEQPWIDACIFQPLRQRNLPVRHLDIKDAPGVDLVGDLADPAFLEQLGRMEFKSVFCSNLLEHVPNREEIAAVLSRLVPAGGYLVLSCPHDYPYHPDPIDTMFRPDAAQLAGLFPGAQVVRAEVLTCGSYWDVLRRKPSRFVTFPLRLMLPFIRPESWKRAAGAVPYLFRPYKAVCVVLRKVAD